ncbi:MAG TPA: Hsp20/alpha crystallin family protein [Fimbriimonadaceae bacterium]|nr:Hsp20/alpha crystallin family protein [Fimbriimonadaceae bacterium]
MAKASDVAELNPTDEKARQQWIALVDVKETPHEVTILVDLPGVDEDEILIEAKNGTVYVSAPRDFDHDNEDAEDYTRLDRPYGEFHCEVPLPELAAPDEMTAKYRRGVLKVNVPCRRRL